MRGRPAGELIILGFAATVCAVLLVVAVGMAVAGAVQPNSALIGSYLSGLSSATAALLGIVLGYLAGRRSEPPKS